VAAWDPKKLSMTLPRSPTPQKPFSGRDYGRPSTPRAPRPSRQLLVSGEAGSPILKGRKEKNLLGTRAVEVTVSGFSGSY
jgi:hypothetical protein